MSTRRPLMMDAAAFLAACPTDPIPTTTTTKTMKLTNYIRDAFIHAAMADVPAVDYQEQARTLVHKALDGLFQKTFPGMDRLKAAESGWLGSTGVNTPRGLGSIYTYATHYNCLEGDAKTWAKLEELAAKHADQCEQRNKLESTLRAVAYSVTTRKALADALPEFAKYLPADEAKAIRSLPVVANVVADFVKAGWPKKAANDRKSKAAA